MGTPSARRPSPAACVSCVTHASIDCQRAGASPETPIAPPGVVCAGGAIRDPLEMGDDQGPHGPESFPPACTLLSLPYCESRTSAPRRTKRMELALVPLPCPTTSGIRWSRNARVAQPDLGVGHRSPSAARLKAARATVRPRLVRRRWESGLAVIELSGLRAFLRWYCSWKTKSRASVVMAANG